MDLETYLDDVRARQARVRPANTPDRLVLPLGELSIPGHVDHWARERPGQAAIVHEGRAISYAELADLVARVAGWLAGAGVRPGDRVAVDLPNCPQFTVAMLAILRLGAVHVPVNPMFQHAELVHELADSGATVLVAVDSVLPVVVAALPETQVRRVLVTSLSDTAPDLPDGLDATPWSEAVAHAPAPEHPADLDALAALNYTGGTTGLPKGCQHTQRHMLYTAATAAAATGHTVETGYVPLCYLPVFWIAGEDLGILNPIVLGGTSVLMTRWDAGAALAAIERHGVTSMVGTVENYLELLEHPDLPARDLSSLKMPMAVSFVRKLTQDVRAAWREAVGAHSVLCEAAYGMTETHTFDATPYGMSEGDKDLLAEPVFCGVPMPGTDIAVVEFGTLHPLPLGEAGEIVVRSPSVMTGYWNRPDATAAQLDRGWLHTGDNGRLDEDGCLHYLGRDKDLIKVKGMSVFPAEVELLLTRHPAVRTAAVVPAADPESGQVPVAFVSLAPDASVSAAELRAWAKTAMAPYKVPLVEVVGEFPMTATGKIRKVELTDRAQRLADER
ncbi:AMP-binding protein [Amycolatopsis echigonensis]|uniref:AMP-binding protein n=1 Tax=Amycolatopsis echigonensis TaxID=2576905 RepID=A0A8E1W2Z8_9PSEU|nr:AMP-binding protein [Amycolatopsis echigonensis]MBB2502752.1 AMP-binding protein [Amycolatopsis echigonensis]